MHSDQIEKITKNHQKTCKRLQKNMEISHKLIRETDRLMAEITTRYWFMIPKDLSRSDKEKAAEKPTISKI
jgi:hypothetical protein